VHEDVDARDSTFVSATVKLDLLAPNPISSRFECDTKHNDTNTPAF
jgi:hypothetical protein